MGRAVNFQVVLTSFLACAFLRFAEASSNCSATQFQCKNKNCIMSRYICDSVSQCGDMSDEEDCAPFQCHSATFQCPNGKCIPHYRICDNTDNCYDNTDEDSCEPFHCHPSAFQCLNGKCLSRTFFCKNGKQCSDNSDEQYCNKQTNDPCPAGWSQCPNGKRCIPSHWVCDGFPDCPGESEEGNCENNTTLIAGNTAVKTELRSWLLRRRKPGSGTDRLRVSQIHRIAVALHLSHNSTFAPGSSTGEEIRYELTIQLLYLLPRNKLSSQELAMYIQAMLVACLDPRDFYGDDLVRELRRRVELSGKYTNPFLILVLCNAGDTMTAKDVERVTAAFHSQHRPFSTDSRALAIMALSCIFSRSDVSADESTLSNMLMELKNHQSRKGTVDNFRTTALVTQALFIHDSYKKDFDFDSAMRILIEGLAEGECILKAYYALPVLHGKSLLNVTSNHCIKQTVAKEEQLEEIPEVSKATIAVHFSVWMGDEINQIQTWKLRMHSNNSVYDAIQKVVEIGNVKLVEYNVVKAKPFITVWNGKENNPETQMFWFIYLKSFDSEEDPKIVEESPVEIKLKPNQEIILWYTSACSAIAG